MSNGKIVGIVLLVIIGLIGLSFGLGYLGVFHTKTVGKARQNAEREVFEQTQSYVEGKRQESAKAYKEWLQADPSSKKALENLARTTFANFDEQKYLLDGPVKTWVYNCKNSIPNSTSTTRDNNPF